MADDMKEAHNARKEAIKKEREIKAARLKNAREEIQEGLQEVLEFHSFLSDLDLQRHSKKSNQELSTAIAQISSAVTNLNKYLKAYKDEE